MGKMRFLELRACEKTGEKFRKPANDYQSYVGVLIVGFIRGCIVVTNGFYCFVRRSFVA